MTTINGNYREFKLDNGLFVALQETPTQTIAARLRINCGALNEEKGQEGLAHFLEHVLVNGGSRKFDLEQVTGIRSALGYTNASTSRDDTNIIADVIPQDIGMCLEFIADSAFYPRLDTKVIDQERQRILREISDMKSRPGFKDIEDSYEALYGKDSPHIYPAAGKEEVIEKATQEDLRQVHTKGFCSDNADLIIVGALPGNIEELIKRYFTDLPRGKKQKFDYPRLLPLKNRIIMHTCAPDLYNHEKPEESNTFFGLTFIGPTDTDKDSYATRLLSQILAGSQTSRIPMRIAEKGLSYHVGCTYHSGNNAGLITFGGTIHSKRTDEALDIIFEQFRRAQKELVCPLEMELLKKRLFYSFAKKFETNEGHIRAIETKIDKNLTVEEYLANMISVTPEQIRNAANQYLPQDRENGKYGLLLRDPLK